MKTTCTLALMWCMLIDTPALGQDVLLTGCALGWGAGGRSSPGERLDLVGTVHLFESRYPADLAHNEYTIVLSGLISTGSVDVGNGLYATAFYWGQFVMYEDPSGNSTYDGNPPNGTVPSSFADGALLLSGVTDFFYVFDGTGTGTRAWAADLHVQSTVVPELLYPGNTVHLRGSYITDSQSLLPGYSLSTSLDLVLVPPWDPPPPLPPAPVWDCASTVGVESRPWGSIKRLYR